MRSLGLTCRLCHKNTKLFSAPPSVLSVQLLFECKMQVGALVSLCGMAVNVCVEVTQVVSTRCIAVRSMS